MKLTKSIRLVLILLLPPLLNNRCSWEMPAAERKALLCSPFPIDLSEARCLRNTMISLYEIRGYWEDTIHRDVEEALLSGFSYARHNRPGTAKRCMQYVQDNIAGVDDPRRRKAYLLTAKTIRCYIAAKAGDPIAQELVEAAADDCVFLQFHEAAGDCFRRYAEVLYDQNRLDEAIGYCLKAIYCYRGVADDMCRLDMVAYVSETMAKIYYVKGDEGKQQECLARADSAAKEIERIILASFSKEHK